MSEPTIDFPDRPSTEQQAPNLPGIQSAYLGPASSASASATGGGGGGVITTAFPGSPTDGERFTLTDSAASPTWYQDFIFNATIGAWIGVGTGRGTALPATPVEGQQFLLTDSLATPTFNWLMWYSTAASSWQFGGGSPAYVSVDTSENVASANDTFADFTTVGPGITVGRAGVYNVRYGATGSGNAAATTSYCGVLVGATVPSESTRTSITSSSGDNCSLESEFRTAAVAASTTIKLQGADHDSTRRVAFGKRWMSLTPITLT